MNDYDGRLFHYDCYRIQSPRQAENLGRRTISSWAAYASWNGARTSRPSARTGKAGEDPKI
ncbi:MAG: hypothetical protein ACLRSW_12055 [Christensenellaceae bacterium]